jgi:hypothetical protein
MLCAIWGCGPWADLDEPPNALDEVMNVIS